MQAVNVIGLIEDIDEVITVLGESGVFHPDEVPTIYSDTKDFTHLITKNIYAEPLTNLKASIDLTKRKIPLVDVSDFSPSFEELERFSNEAAKERDRLVDEKERISAQLTRAKENQLELSHFKGLDIKLEKMLNLNYLKTRFGRLPKESFTMLSAYKDNPYVEFNICTEVKSHYWGVYFAPIDNCDEITEYSQVCILINATFWE